LIDYKYIRHVSQFVTKCRLICGIFRNVFLARFNHLFIIYLLMVFIVVFSICFYYQTYLWRKIRTTTAISHSWRITGFVTGATLMKQELLILPEHASSPRIVVGFVLFDLLFCRSLFILWSFFCFPLSCLSFDLRILINYPFGIFKLFSQVCVKRSPLRHRKSGF
jgi:hypothetical protein